MHLAFDAVVTSVHLGTLSLLPTRATHFPDFVFYLISCLFVTFLADSFSSALPLRLSPWFFFLPPAFAVPVITFNLMAFKTPSLYLYHTSQFFPQTCVSYSLLSLSTWKSNRHVKVNVLKLNYLHTYAHAHTKYVSPVTFSSLMVTLSFYLLRLKTLELCLTHFSLKLNLQSVRRFC